MTTRYIIVKTVLAETIYTVISIIFSINLYRLNQTLLNNNLDDSALKLLSYAGGKPIKYLIITIILALIGVLLILHKYRVMRDRMLEAVELLLSIVCICIILAIIITLWILIDNPIARAAIAVAGIGGALVAADS